MYISYSGVISPYLYNCPYAHFLRNVLKVKALPKEHVKEEQEQELNKRTRGIELHEQLCAYLKQEEDEFAFVTDTITLFREHPLVQVEQSFYFDLDFQVIAEPSFNDDFYGIRPDAFIYYDGELHIADWKFANTEYNSTRYYGEVEFFIALMSNIYPDIQTASSYIHFPEQDYTLPSRKYSAQAISKLQQHYIFLVDKIINTNILKPTPAKFRCAYCNFRSEDTGGIGQCEHTCV